jgi:hypothetical protein
MCSFAEGVQKSTRGVHYMFIYISILGMESNLIAKKLEAELAVLK